MKPFKSLFAKGKRTKEPHLSGAESAKDTTGAERTDFHQQNTKTLPQEVVEALKAPKAGETPPRQPTQAPAPSSRRSFIDMKTGSDFKPQIASVSKQKATQVDEVTPPKQAVDFAEVKGGGGETCDDFVESPAIARAYDAVPILEQTKLPRGGVSVDTKAVGRVQVRKIFFGRPLRCMDLNLLCIQYGIPPETIKDSMRLGIPVPQVYIVPTERFSREMGPALGVNLAEFEFPAYFNYFVYKKKCTLVVDSADAEDNIRKVFSETLLGPEQFRREKFIAYEEEDFAPDFPKEAIPDFQKELKHFRIMPDGQELVIETLLDFRHFEDLEAAQSLGSPKPTPGDEEVTVENLSVNEVSEEDQAQSVPANAAEAIKRGEQSRWTYSDAISNGDVSRIYPFSATPEEIAAGKVQRVEIFKMPGGTEYIIHDINENNEITGKARLSGHVKVSEFMSVDGFGGRSFLDAMDPSNGEKHLENPSRPLKRPSFHPPSFGVTVLGNSHGFDKSGSVSGYVLWVNGRGVMIDPPPYSSATLEREGIRPRTIVGIILTHCHADHDAGAFQKVLTGSPVVVITTPTIYKSFIRKYSALSALSPALLRHSHRYKPAIIGQPLRFQGATFHFTYTLHAIPCVGFRVEWRGRSMVFTGDHFNNPAGLEKLVEKGVMSKARMDDLNYLPLQDCDVLLHESGAPPIHTPLEVLLQLPKHVKERLYVVHTSALPDDCELRVAPTGTAGTIRLDTSSSHGRNAAHRGSDENIWIGGSPEYSTIAEESEHDLDHSFGHLAKGKRGKATQRTSCFSSVGRAPLVSLRPASSTDAWYILNLLSAVPFLSR
jgi:glyoxylase-like metal-dependent hydrolase (beta-lactamase superfamily II)